MNNLIDEIQHITRPKMLMVAARQVVQSKKTNEVAMGESELNDLILRERQCEEKRQMRSGHYSIEEHVSVLARLIYQALLAGRRKKAN